MAGIARLSSNWLLSRLAGGYVELIRNLPLLFQILFWYLAVLGTLPQPRDSIALFGTVFLAYAAALHRRYSDRLARAAFRYSILYLALLFGALLVDHYL